MNDELARVYLLWGDTDYEGSGLLEIYSRESDAAAALVACKAHEERRPRCPEAADGEDNDREWDEWYPKEEAWKAQHPGGEAAWLYHAFSVGAVEVRPPQASPAADKREARAAGESPAETSGRPNDDPKD